MKTITLRTLVREPLKVKRMTRTGHPVRVTDNGAPLWVLRSADASTKESEADRRHAIDEILEDVLNERPSKVSAVRLLEDSRR